MEDLNMNLKETMRNKKDIKINAPEQEALVDVQETAFNKVENADLNVQNKQSATGKDRKNINNSATESANGASSVKTRAKGRMKKKGFWQIAGIAALAVCLAVVVTLGIVPFETNNYTGNDFVFNIVEANDTASADWQAAVTQSLADTDDRQRTVKLTADWGAASDGTYTTSFGTGTGFQYGALLVPAGANIVLDLNGHTLSRNLTAARANGFVIAVYGKLTIKDTSTSKLGMVTGAYTNGTDHGAITVFDSTVESSLDFQSGTVSGNYSASTTDIRSTAGISIWDTATLTMHDGAVVSGNHATGFSVAGVVIWGKFNAAGGSITGNDSNFRSGLLMFQGGTPTDPTDTRITVSNISVSNNSVTSANKASNSYPAAGIYLDGGSFTGDNIKINGNIGDVNNVNIGFTCISEKEVVLKNSEVLNNTITDVNISTENNSTAGIIVYENSSNLRMENTQISGNVAGGAGVYADSTLGKSGVVTLVDCTITNNKVCDPRQSNVFVTGYATLNMEGCSVTGNKVMDYQLPATSKVGLTVYVEKSGNLNLKDCTISGNEIPELETGDGGGVATAFGVRVDAGDVSLSGYCYIYDNVNSDGKQANIWLYRSTENRYLTINGAISNGSKIGVRRMGGGPLTSGWQQYNGNTDPLTVFTDENEAYYEVAYSEIDKEIIVESDGTKHLEAVIIPHDPASQWEYAIEQSLAHDGAAYTATLYEEWNPNSSFSFGTNTNYYWQGALYVPEGANVILEMNGFNVDRKLTARRTNGLVILVDGELTIRDTGGKEKMGSVRGGWNQTTDVGAGVHVNGKLTLESGYIDKNRTQGYGSAYGGASAVQVSAGAEFVMTGGGIDHNIGFNDARAVYQKATIDLAAATANAPGAKFTMTGGSIDNNTLSDCLIWVGNGAVADISGGSIHNNYNQSNTLGRVFAIEEGGTANVRNIEIYENESNKTDIIASYGTLTMDHVTFRANVATTVAGSHIIYSHSATPLTLTNCTFTENHANSAIINEQAGNLVVDNCTFERNESINYGVIGFESETSSREGHSTISNSHFIENTGYNGVAIMSYIGHNEYPGTLTISGCEFRGNSSNTITRKSGSILDITVADVSDCTIADNYAYGSVVSVAGPNTVSTFRNCEIVNNHGIEGTLSTQKYVGQLFNVWEGTVELIDTNINGNTTASRPSTGYEQGSTPLMYVWGTLKLTNVEISNNTTVGPGDILTVNETSGSISIGGKIIIANNNINTEADLENGEANLYLENTAGLIYIHSALASGSKIGVWRGGNGALTSGYGQFHNQDPWATFFFNDLKDWYESKGENVVENTTVGSAKTYEAAERSLDPASMWEFAIKSSLRDGIFYTCKLESDWNAKNGKFGTDSQCYVTAGTNNAYGGALLVPEGAKVILDMNGHNVNRGLTAHAVYGYVIEVAGELIIQDSSSTDPALQGSVTGGFNRTTNYPSAMYVDVSGEVTLKSGWINGNKSVYYSSSYKGGSTIHVEGTFNMEGGQIANNTLSVNANLKGSLIQTYNENAVVNITGGSITDNTCGNGILWVYNAKVPQISNVLIQGNSGQNHLINLPHSDYNDGNLTVIENVTFKENSTTMQGLLESVNGVIVRNCTFEGNHTTDYLIACDANCEANLTIEDCTFTNNTIPWKVDTWMISAEGHLEIRNTEFTGNFAHGLILNTTNSSGTWQPDSVIDNINVHDNEIAYLIHTYDGRIEVKNSYFVNNFYEHATAGSVFETNMSTGVDRTDVTNSVITVDNCVVTGNRQAVGVAWINYGKIIIKNSDIQNNASFGNFAVFGTDTADSAFEIEKTVIKGNNGTGQRANEGQNGLIASYGSVTLKDVEITDNIGWIVVYSSMVEFAIGGKNIIQHNLYKNDYTNGKYEECDLDWYIDNDDTEPKRLKVLSSLAGSKMGVWCEYTGKITDGYGVYNTADPTTIFYTDNENISKVIKDGEGNSMEAATLSSDPSANWVYAVSSSLEAYEKTGVVTPYTCELFKDMTPSSGTSFGSVTNCYTSGMMYVPQNAHVILEMNGYNVDRKLTKATANGGIFYVEGILEIRNKGRDDITDEEWNNELIGGSITGAWNNTQYLGAITVMSTGKVVIHQYESNDGSNKVWWAGVHGNKCTNQNSAGGIYVDGGVLEVDGIYIDNNTASQGNSVGGLRALNGATVKIHGGSISGNKNTVGVAGIWITDSNFEWDTHIERGEVFGGSFQGNNGRNDIYIDSQDAKCVASFKKVTFSENVATVWDLMSIDGNATGNEKGIEVTIEDCIFENNTLTKTTGNNYILETWSNVDLVVKNTVFRNNTANSIITTNNFSGSNVPPMSSTTVFENVDVIDNSSHNKWSLMGNYGSEFTWTGGTVSGNTNIGGVFWHGCGNATLTGVTFDNNQSVTSGDANGTVIADTQYNVAINLDVVNCTFTNNTGRDAGGILINESQMSGITYTGELITVNITGGKFENNSAATEASGGAILIALVHAVVTVDGTEFIGNSGYAGVVNVWGTVNNVGNARLILNNTIMRNNFSTTQTDGESGAITCYDTLEIHGGEFTDNTGFWAGAIFLQNAARAVIDNGAIISGNTGTSPTAGVGGIWIYPNKAQNVMSTTLSVSNAQIKNNKGTMFGGIFIGSTGTSDGILELSNVAYIQENVNGSDKKANVGLANDSLKIKVVGQFLTGASIGVTRTAINVFTEGYGQYNYAGAATVDPTAYFTADSPNTTIIKYSDGQDMEAQIFSFDNKKNWSNAVSSSLADNGNTKVFTMFTDWEAEPDTTNGTSFGDIVGYRYGALYVPAGASVILDLRGYQLNRNLSAARNHGYVIWVEGELIIRDSGAFDPAECPPGIVPSTRRIGEITGGKNNGQYDGAAGVTVDLNGHLRIEGGSIKGNSSSGINGVGGVYAGKDTSFEMTGGEIDGNTGFDAGGLWFDCPTATITGGSIINNKSTKTIGSGGIFVAAPDDYAKYSKTLNVGGNLVVKNNLNYGDQPCNVWIQPGNENMIQVVAPFTADAEIYISRGDVGVFTKDFGTHNAGTLAGSVFKADSKSYFVEDEEVDGINEASFICKDGTLNWAHAVKTSLAENGAQKKVTLYEDWIATDGSFGDDTGYSSGRLYVPSGANIVLDLAGHTVDRHLLDTISNGSVMYIAGTLTIIDSVGGGKITGGNSDGTGGIFISAGGTLNFEGGTVFGNKSTAAENGAGINVAGTLNLKGGSVTDNVGVGNGGIYVENEGVVNFGGDRQFADCPLTPSEVYNNKIDKDGTGTDLKDSNILLSDEYAKINIVSPLTNTHKYGIQRENLGEFTTGFGINMPTAIVTDYFVAEPSAADGGKYYVGQIGSGGMTEGVMLTDDNSLNWSYAVKTSLEQGGTRQVVTLNKDWFADDDPNAYFKSFGPDSKPGFERGALYVPDGANIVLDLNGHKVDRNFAALDTDEGKYFRTYGYVFNVEGTFEIRDSVGGGIVTGGRNTSPARAGGVQVNGGNFKLSGGSIEGNESHGNGSVGGVLVSSGMFTMVGGKVTGNWGGSAGFGGVYIGPSVEFNLGGQSDIYGNKIINSEVEEGDNSNLYIDSATKKINIITDEHGAQFTPTQPIGLTRAGLGAFTLGYGAINGSAGSPGAISPTNCFVSDHPLYTVKGAIVDNVYEGIMDTDDNAMRWEHAINTSLSKGGSQEIFDLRLDGWTATSHKSYTTAFGTAAGAYYYGALYVPAGANIVLDLNGRALNRALSAKRQNGYVILVEGTLTITDLTDAKLGYINGGRNSSGAGAIVIAKTGSVVFESGTLQRNQGSTAGAVQVNGTFTLAGGSILSNSSTTAGGVYVNTGAVFNMNSGFIQENNGTTVGGVYNSGDFIMESAPNSSTYGHIQQNSGLAGGVYVSNGTFTLRNGSISQNNGTNTGGVYIYNSANSKFYMEGGEISTNEGIAAGGVFDAGIFEMTGGIINANKATGTSKTTGGGSGVYILGTGTFTMLGGEVSGNVGMNGVRAYSSAILNMGGSAKVYANTNAKGELCNVYLSIPSRKINIVSEFEENNARIQVTRDSAGVFTSGYGATNTILPMSVFVSDKPQYAVAVANIQNEDGSTTIEATIGTPIAAPVDVTETIKVTYNSQQQIVITGYNSKYMTVDLPTGTFLDGSDISAINAGSYSVVFKLKDGYCWSNGSNEDLQIFVDIKPFVVDIEWEGDEYTYDGEMHTPTATVTNLFPGDVCGVTVAGGAINVGTHTAVASLLSNSNYALYDADLPGASPEMQPKHDFEIVKASITPEITTLEAEFGKDLQLKVSGNLGKGTVHFYRVDESGNIIEEFTDGIYTPTTADVDAGMIKVKAVIDATDNTFEGETPITDIVVNKGSAPLELEEDTVIYGDSFTLQLKDYLNAGEINPVFTIVGGTGMLELAGTYAIAKRAGTVKIEISVEETTYYKATTVTVTVTVKQKVVKLDWNNLEFVYDGYVHVPSATINSDYLVDGDSVTVTVSGGQINAGTHTAKAVMLSNPNYTLVGSIDDSATHDFEIERADIKIEIVKDEVDKFNQPTGYVGAVYGVDKELKLKITANMLGDANYDVTDMFKPEDMEFMIAKIENIEQSPDMIPDEAFQPIDGVILTPPAAGWYALRARVHRTDNFYASDKLGNNQWSTAILHVSKGDADLELEKYQYEYGTETGLVLKGLDNTTKITFSVREFSDPEHPEYKKGGAIVVGNSKLLGTKLGWVTVVAELTASDNFNVPQTLTFDVEIVPKTLEITWGDVELIYNAAEQMPNYTLDLFGTDDVKLDMKAIDQNGDYIPSIEVNDYKAIVLGLKGAQAGNYVLKYPQIEIDGVMVDQDITVDYVIKKKKLTLSWRDFISADKPIELEYTGEEQTPRLNINGICPNDICTPIISGAQKLPNPTDVPKYVAEFLEMSNPNYEYEFVTGQTATVNFVISRPTIEITLKEDTVDFGHSLELEAVVKNGKGDIITDVGEITFELVSPSSMATLENGNVLTPLVFQTVTVKVKVEGNGDLVPGGEQNCYVHVKKGFAPIELKDKYAYYGTEYAISINDLVDISGEHVQILSYRIEGILGSAGSADDLGGGKIMPTHIGKIAIYIRTNETTHFNGNEEIKIELDILPRLVTLDWDGDSYDYDGEEHCPTAEVTNPAMVDGSLDQVNVTVDGAQTNAGTYNAHAIGLDNENYCLVDPEREYDNWLNGTSYGGTNGLVFPIAEYPAHEFVINKIKLEDDGFDKAVILNETITYGFPEFIEFNGLIDPEEIIYSVVNGTGSATISADGELTPASAGKIIVKAIIKEKNYEAYEIEKEIEITKNTEDFELVEKEVVYGDTLELDITGYGENRTVTYELTEYGDGNATLDGNVLTALGVGKVYIKITVAPSDDYQGGEKTEIVTILPRVIQVEWTMPEQPYTYNGTIQRPEVTLVNAVEGDDVELIIDATKDAGDKTATITGTTNPNYTIEEAENLEADYVILPAPITFTWETHRIEGEVGDRVYYFTSEEIAPKAIIDEGCIFDGDECEVVVKGGQVDASPDPYEAVAYELTNSNYTLEGLTNLTTLFKIIVAHITPDLTTTDAYYGEDLELEISGNIGKGTVHYYLLDENGNIKVDEDGNPVELKDGVYTPTKADVDRGLVKVIVRVEETENTYSYPNPYPTTADHTDETEFVINVHKGKLPIKASANKAVYGTELNFVVNGNVEKQYITLTLKEGGTGEATLSHDGELVAHDTVFQLMPTKVGTVLINVKIAASDYYDEVDFDIEFTIVPRPVVLDWTYPEFTYNGQEQVPTAEVTNKVGDDECIVFVQGQVNAGTDLEAEAIEIRNADGTINENYTVEKGVNITTKYIIKPRPVTIEWGDTTLTFSGEEQAPEATINGLIDGDECELVIEGKELNVGNNYVAKVIGVSNPNYTVEGGNNLEIGFEITIAVIEIEIITVETLMGVPLKLEVSGNIGKGEETYEMLGGGTGSAYIEYNAEENCYYLIPTATGTVNIKAFVAETPNSTAATSEDTEVSIIKAPAPINIVTSSIEYGTTEKLIIENNVEYATLQFGVISGYHDHNGNTIYHYGKATINQDGDITGTMAGTICVTVTVPETANYIETTITKQITVRPRVLEITWGNLEVTYNGQRQYPNVWATNVVPGDSVTLRASLYPGVIDAGIYDVTAGIYKMNNKASGNYTLSGVNVANKFIIGRAVLSDITLKNKETTIDKDLLLELLNNHGGGAVTYTVSRDTGDATVDGDILSPLQIGKVRVTISVEQSQNYAARTVEEIVDIGKRYAPLSYTGALETIYGQDLEIVLDSNSVPSGSSIVYDVQPGTGAARILGTTLIPIHAGTVKLLITSSETADYQATTLEIEITIKPIVVELEWDPDTLEFLFDGNEHKPSAKIKDGILINGDTCEVFINGGQINAGTHTAEAATLSNSDYTLEGCVNRTQDFLIVQNELVIEIITTEAVYGTDLELLLSGNDGGGAVTWTVENITGSATVNGNVLTPTNVGQVYVTATVAASNNYGSATVSAVVTISKMTSGIEFNAADLIYGNVFDLMNAITGIEENAKVTFTVVPGTGTATVDGTNITPTQVGTITVTATVAATNHYDGAVLSQTFQIAPRPVKLKWSQEEFVYNKTIQAPTATVDNLAFPTDECIVTVQGGMNAGKSVKATATALSNPNYTLENGEFIETTYEIKPCVAILEWETGEFIYNGREQKPKATVSNLYEGDECEVTVMGATNAGNPLKANAILLSNTNYTLEGCENKSEEFEIKPLVAEIDWANLALVYNGKAQTPEAVVRNAIEGDVFEMTYTGAQTYVNAVTGEAFYVAVLTGLGNDNYQLPENCETQFTIVPLEIEFTWDSLTLTYNGQTQAPSYTITNIKNSDDVRIEFIGAGKDVGWYTAALTLAGDDSANYTIKSTDLGVRYEITAKEITVTIKSNDVYVVYTGEEITELKNWYTLTTDGLEGDDAQKTIEELFETIDLVLNPRFWQNGTTVKAQENGDYDIEPILLGGGVSGNGNYSVKVEISEDYGVLTIGAPQSLKLSEDTVAQFITENAEEAWGEYLYYRRTYAELGWTHGIDDIDLDRIVLGQIMPESTVMKFLKCIDESQRDIIRLYDGYGTLVYDRGKPASGFSESDMDDSEMYCVGTGWYMELMNVDTVVETIYISVLGDIDGDGLIMGSDAVAILSYLDGLMDFDILEFRLAAYVMNSGMIDSMDNVEILTILDMLSTIESHYYTA